MANTPYTPDGLPIDIAVVLDEHEREEKSALLSLIKQIRESFPDAEEVYTRGSCVKFAMILKEVFPKGTILWDEHHAIFELGGTCFDVGGVTEKGNHIPLKEYGENMMYDIMSLTYEKDM